MILFLCGPDTYRSSQKVKEIAERYKSIHKSGMSFKVFESEKEDFDTFKNAVQSAAMFGEKKLVILKGYSEDKEFSVRFLSWERREFLKESKDSIALFYEEGFKKGNDLILWLLKNSKHEEFALLAGMKLFSWARGYAAKHGIPIEPAALTRLAIWCKGDLWLFVNEAQKLKAYKKGGKIVTDDLRFLTDFSSNSIFSLIDAIVAGNKPYALKALQERLEAGDDELQIFSLLCKQFSVIALGKANPPLTRETGLHPFVVKKALFQARRFSDEGIKKIYRTLADLDLSMKVGKIMPKQALEQLIFFL